MSMPTIPPMPHRPCKKEVIIDLLASIALEEIALSHIMNAEGEKIQAFVGKCLDFPTHPSNAEIIRFNKSVVGLLDTVVMKEWLLLKKLEKVLEFDDLQCHCKNDCKCKHVCKCRHDHHHKPCKCNHKPCKCDSDFHK